MEALEDEGGSIGEQLHDPVVADLIADLGPQRTATGELRYRND